MGIKLLYLELESPDVNWSVAAVVNCQKRATITSFRFDNEYVFDYDLLVQPYSWREFAKSLSDPISWPTFYLLRELLKIS